MSSRSRVLGWFVVALVIGLGNVAFASDGDPLVLGSVNVADTTTTLINSQGGGTGKVEFVDPLGFFAVRATNVNGPAVEGNAVSEFSVGVQANGGPGFSFEIDLNQALDVHGAASFSRSGLARVPAGSSHVTISGQDLGTDAFALATVQSGPPSVWVSSVRLAHRNEAQHGTITIALNRAVQQALDVAWIVLN